MFGGHGLYLDELFVAIVADDTLYLKVDALTRARFETAGARPLVYESAGRRVALGFWTAPETAMDSPAAMAPWIRLATDAAVRARARPAGSARQRSVRA
jgi:DNA transformation protein